MLKSLQFLFVTALMGAATLSHAQETATEETATEVAQVPSDLSMGEEVNRVGQPYIAEQSGDWALRCMTTPPDQPDPCQLYQLLKDAEGNAVAEISMFPLPPGSQAAAGATIVVPLETLLTQQLTLSVDGAATRRYPFTFCNAAGCVARVGFTEEEVTQFKRGNVATLRMVPAAAPDQEVILDVSLTGFTAGFDNTVDPNAE